MGNGGLSVITQSMRASGHGLLIFTRGPCENSSAKQEVTTETFAMREGFGLFEEVAAAEHIGGTGLTKVVFKKSDNIAL